MKKFWRDEQGTVVFPVVAMGVCMAILAATVLMVASMSARVQHLSGAHDSAYWIARGGVRATVIRFHGESLPPEQSTWSLPDGHLSVTVEYQTLWQVRATAVSEDAVVTVLCGYDPKRRRVVYWQENAPYP